MTTKSKLFLTAQSNVRGVPCDVDIQLSIKSDSFIPVSNVKVKNVTISSTSALRLLDSPSTVQYQTPSISYAEAQRHYLNVPIQEKEIAKEKGAKWDPTMIKWYVPIDPLTGNCVRSNLPVEAFARWDTKLAPAPVATAPAFTSPESVKKATSKAKGASLPPTGSEDTSDDHSSSDESSVIVKRGKSISPSRRRNPPKNSKKAVPFFEEECDESDNEGEDANIKKGKEQRSLKSDELEHGWEDYEDSEEEPAIMKGGKKRLSKTVDPNHRSPLKKPKITTVSSKPLSTTKIKSESSDDEDSFIVHDEILTLSDHETLEKEKATVGKKCYGCSSYGVDHICAVADCERNACILHINWCKACNKELCDDHLKTKLHECVQRK